MLERNVEYFSFYVICHYEEGPINICYIESRNKEIITCKILDNRRERILNFYLGEKDYQDITFFLKKRTLLDAPKSNLSEIYESIQQSKGEIWTDPLSIEFVEFNA